MKCEDCIYWQAKSEHDNRMSELGLKPCSIENLWTYYPK